MNKSYLAIIIIFIGLIVLLFTFEKRIQIFKDQNIVVEERARLLHLFNIHASKPRYLLMTDKWFKGVRGTSPFYLSIPEMNAILFVTEDNDRKVQFHIVDLKTKQVIDIDGRGSGFGGDIGSSKKPGEPFTDYVENATGNKLVLAKFVGDWKELTTLNLISRSIERDEIFWYDKNGGVKKHEIIR